MHGHCSLYRRAKLARVRTIAEQQDLFGEFLEFPEPPAGSRKRLFDPLQTFWMFLHQVLAGNLSCHETLQRTLAWLARESGECASPNTAAYCKARARLELPWLRRIGAQASASIEARASPAQQWLGRSVKAVDGSGLSMPDTPANQAAWPQPGGQKPGCGFPVMRFVALFSLATGVMLRVERGTLKTAERPLFRKLWDALAAGDVLLGDSGFTSYADFHLLKQRGVDSVMRNHQRRSAGVTPLKRLGRRDQLVVWKKTGACPKWMQPAEWAALPREMIVRQLDVPVEISGFRPRVIILVTTLLDHKTCPAAEFARLYRRRWQAELFLRDIKISLGMDVLKCKTPAMVEKELELYVLAYNLMRGLICKAAQAHGANPERISFKRTADALKQWTPVLLAARHDPTASDRLTKRLLAYIARCINPDRPSRSEHRAVKRRPKNYQRLTQPRHQFQEGQHRNHYAKGLS